MGGTGLSMDARNKPKPTKQSTEEIKDNSVHKIDKFTQVDCENDSIKIMQLFEEIKESLPKENYITNKKYSCKPSKTETKYHNEEVYKKLKPQTSQINAGVKAQDNKRNENIISVLKNNIGSAMQYKQIKYNCELLNKLECRKIKQIYQMRNKQNYITVNEPKMNNYTLIKKYMNHKMTKTTRKMTYKINSTLKTRNMQEHMKNWKKRKKHVPTWT